MPDLDRTRSNAAADRGLLAAFWAERQPDRVAVYLRGGQPHVRRGQRATRTGWCARCGRAACRPGDGVALMCSNRPEFVETVVAARRAGLRLTTINWHLTGDEAGYIVDDCEATAFVADARFADVGRGARPSSRRGCARRSRSAATIDGFEEWDDVLAPEAGVDIDDPRRRRHDALHVGHDRPAEGRAPAARSARARSTSRALTQYRGDRHVHLLHRAAVPRRAAVVLAGRRRPRWACRS